MEADYIASLNAAYDDYFTAPDGARAHTPVLIIDTEHLDFVANRDDLRRVAEQLQSALGLGAYQVALPLEGA
jgi:deoxyadenosine/deoxycytidine kinase